MKGSSASRIIVEQVKKALCRNHCLRYRGTTSLQYVQGQSPSPKTREYFYFIDHQGQLFLDDARMKNFTSCFKEKDFLVFFFKRLKPNRNGKYDEYFPYISPCGRERNFVRCDDTPIVFTHIIPSSKDDDGSCAPDQLCYGGAGDRMSVEFRPMDVCMLPDSYRVYHPAPDQYGGIGLIKSSLAIELSKDFEFEFEGAETENDETTRPPSHFTWRGTRYQLTNRLFDVVKDKNMDV